MNKTILSLYDESGNMVRPWLYAGYNAIIVDQLHPKGVHEELNVVHKTTLFGQVIVKHVSTLTKIGGDIREIKESLKQFDNIVFVAAFPPCTDLAVSGARWFESKRNKDPLFQDKAMELIYIARDIAEHYNVPYFIENPVSVVSTLWRKPDYIFHPYEYSGHFGSDHYRKKTCLWTNDKFNMPATCYDPDIEIDSRIHRMAPSPTRAKMRSRTPMGFAKAVFLANSSVN
jgi:hypothetical protein